jgi:hypothetical protein
MLSTVEAIKAYLANKTAEHEEAVKKIAALPKPAKASAPLSGHAIPPPWPLTAE